MLKGNELFSSYSQRIKIELDLKNNIYLEVDKLRFRQVLANINSNAIKNNA